MRTIEATGSFRRDLKRERKGKYRKSIDPLLRAVLHLLCANKPLPTANRDHPLSGDWNGYRDCHLKPDLVLIYRLPNESTLQLVRLGSHSELFG